MKAAVLEAYHEPLVIRDVDLPPPGRGEVTIEVKACGLCLTDVHISEGKIPTVEPPLIPGHEFAGVVAGIGENVDGWKLGDRVTVCVDVNCGQCEFCLRGESNRCARLKRIGFERDGGMAELANVPADNSYDVVVDNVGIKDTVFQAVQACRNGGKVVAMGYVDPTLEIPSYEIVIKEKQVVGSRALTRAEFGEVVGLVNSGQLDPDIGELIPIHRINEALKNLRNGRYLTRSVLMLPFGS